MKTERLAGIGMVARLFACQLLYRRAVKYLAVALLLIVLTALLSGAMLLCGCYIAYLALIQQGVGAAGAAMAVGGVLMLLTLGCGMLALYFIRKLRDAFLPMPALPYAKRVGSAFMDGFSEAGHRAEKA